MKNQLRIKKSVFFMVITLIAFTKTVNARKNSPMRDQMTPMHCDSHSHNGAIYWQLFSNFASPSSGKPHYISWYLALMCCPCEGLGMPPGNMVKAIQENYLQL